MEYVNVRIEDAGGHKTWVYTKTINAFIGNTLYFMGEKWQVVEVEGE